MARGVMKAAEKAATKPPAPKVSHKIEALQKQLAGQSTEPTKKNISTNPGEKYTSQAAVNSPFNQRVKETNSPSGGKKVFQRFSRQGGPNANVSAGKKTQKAQINTGAEEGRVKKLTAKFEANAEKPDVTPRDLRIVPGKANPVQAPVLNLKNVTTGETPVERAEVKINTAIHSVVVARHQANEVEVPKAENVKAAVSNAHNKAASTALVVRNPEESVVPIGRVSPDASDLASVVPVKEEKAIVAAAPVEGPVVPRVNLEEGALVPKATTEEGALVAKQPEAPVPEPKVTGQGQELVPYEAPKEKTGDGDGDGKPKAQAAAAAPEKVTDEASQKTNNNKARSNLAQELPFKDLANVAYREGYGHGPGVVRVITQPKSYSRKAVKKARKEEKRLLHKKSVLERARKKANEEPGFLSKFAAQFNIFFGLNPSHKDLKALDEAYANKIKELDGGIAAAQQKQVYEAEKAQRRASKTNMSKFRRNLIKGIAQEQKAVKLGIGHYFNSKGVRRRYGNEGERENAVSGAAPPRVPGEGEPPRPDNGPPRPPSENASLPKGNTNVHKKPDTGTEEQKLLEGPPNLPRIGSGSGNTGTKKPNTGTGNAEAGTKKPKPNTGNNTAAKTKKNPNNLKLLGLNNTATHEQIKKAYRKLAAQYHPDKNPSPEAQAKFELIAAAYKRLDNAINPPRTGNNAPPKKPGANASAGTKKNASVGIQQRRVTRGIKEQTTPDEDQKYDEAKKYYYLSYSEKEKLAQTAFDESFPDKGQLAKLKQIPELYNAEVQRKKHSMDDDADKVMIDYDMKVGIFPATVHIDKKYQEAQRYLLLTPEEKREKARQYLEELFQRQGRELSSEGLEKFIQQKLDLENKQNKETMEYYVKSHLNELKNKEPFKPRTFTNTELDDIISGKKTGSTTENTIARVNASLHFKSYKPNYISRGQKQNTTAEENKKYEKAMEFLGFGYKNETDQRRLAEKAFDESFTNKEELKKLKQETPELYAARITDKVNDMNAYAKKIVADYDIKVGRFPTLPVVYISKKYDDAETYLRRDMNHKRQIAMESMVSEANEKNMNVDKLFPNYNEEITKRIKEQTKLATETMEKELSDYQTNFKMPSNTAGLEEAFSGKRPGSSNSAGTNNQTKKNTNASANATAAAKKTANNAAAKRASNLAVIATKNPELDIPPHQPKTFTNEEQAKINEGLEVNGIYFIRDVEEAANKMMSVTHPGLQDRLSGLNLHGAWVGKQYDLETINRLAAADQRNLEKAETNLAEFLKKVEDGKHTEPDVAKTKQYLEGEVIKRKQGVKDMNVLIDTYKTALISALEKKKIDNKAKAEENAQRQKKYEEYLAANPPQPNPQPKPKPSYTPSYFSNEEILRAQYFRPRIW